MAKVKKSKAKKWTYLVDFEVNGKRYVRSTRTQDRKTAELALKEIEVQIAKGFFDKEEFRQKKAVSYEEFVQEYLEYSSKRKARKTYLRDRLTFKNFEKFVGAPSLRSIGRKLADDYVNHRVDSVSKSTVNLELRHLKAAFTVAVKWGYVDQNPFKGVKPLVLPQRAPSFFTEEQLQSILKRIEEHWLRNVVLFAARTGVRIGELVNIEWTDVDFDNAEISIRNKKDFTTKSKKERTIPFKDEVFGVLTGISRTGNYVFESRCGGRKSSARISKLFTKYLREAGYGKEFIFHSLRHTFASHLVQKGVSLYIVSKLLGHSNIKTTEVYAHLSPETFHDAVSLLGAQHPTTSTQLSVVHAKQANLDA